VVVVVVVAEISNGVVEIEELSANQRVFKHSRYRQKTEAGRSNVE